MKKIYFFLALLLGVNLSNAQIYNATVETGSRYNPLNDSIASFDDIVLNVGSPNAGANVVITQVQAGFRRLANAPAVDVALYLGRMGSNRIPFNVDSIYQTSLAANGASSVTTLITATNAAGWTLNLDTISNNNSRRGFFVGLRHRGPNALNNDQGWRMVQTPTVGFADTTFYLVNVPRNTLSGPFLFSTAPGAAKAIFYTIITGTVNIVTPVKLSFFKASYLGESASLFWNVESEINFKEYIIESSYDGMSYKKIGVVEARNSKSYEFNLGILNRGKNYFRLKMVDKDGKFEYSSVEVLESKSIIPKLSILTNPVFGNLNFNWSAEGTYRFQIIGIDGKQFKIGAVLNGMNSIDLSNFKQGTYVLDIINAKEEVVEAKKVIKL
jgi:hypothetical protein